MRSREEIQRDTGYREQVKATLNEQGLILELLLDIRELLAGKSFGVRPQCLFPKDPDPTCGVADAPE